MHGWPLRVWWLEKHYWADSECALNTVDAVYLPLLTLVLFSPIVSPCFVFHRSRCDPALPVFASSCVQVSRYALTACAMWSRGSWRGGSLVSAWYFVASLTRWYGLVVWLFFVWLLLCHTNWDDTKLSPLALINPFHPWTGICHVSFCWLVSCFCLVVFFGVFVCRCFLFVLVLCFCFFLCFGVVIVTVHRTTYRSFTSSLLRPLNRRWSTYAIINQLIPYCNME